MFFLIGLTHKIKPHQHDIFRPDGVLIKGNLTFSTAATARPYFTSTEIEKEICREKRNKTLLFHLDNRYTLSTPIGVFVPYCLYLFVRF